jgi:beta-N-acetylhexosaminidase
MWPGQDLSLEDRIGQLFWIGFAGTALGPALRRVLDRVRPGGLVLFSRNIERASQVRALTDALYRSLRVPPFIALDQEGGRVNRLRPILGPTPECQALAIRPDAMAAVSRHAAATAATLKALGFNVNFAPVLDLSGPDPANGIGDRAFGPDPLRVASLARAYLETLLGAGVIPVGKHFPGLGSARADTHQVLPVINRPRSTLWKRDLLPYRRLKRLLPMVMVGHACYPALQGKRREPATLSRAVVEETLRRRLGYRGLVLTDDLEMGAVDQGLNGETVALAALAAGSDGLMFCRSEARILEAREGVLRAVAGGSVGLARINRSLRRIFRLKERYLAARLRGRYSPGAVARSRSAIEALGIASAGGPDQTARF